MFLVEKVHVYVNKNARVFTEDGSFMQGDVVVKDTVLTVFWREQLTRMRLLTAHSRRL